MTVTKKELENEIARFSAFVNNKLQSSQRIIDKVNGYFEKEKPLDNIVGMSKPILQKKKLELEIVALKARLEVIKHLIEMKRKAESEKDKP